MELYAQFLLLDDLSQFHQPKQTPTGSGDEPWSGLSDKLTQAVSLYSRATPVDSDHLYGLLTYLYCCAVLRHASLLFSVWSSKGWGPLAFAGMLRSSSTPYLPPTVSLTNGNSLLNLEQLTVATGISRAQISSVLAQCHGPWLLHLGAVERLATLESMAAIYACLGYKRKEAYFLREVLGCVMDLLVCGRREAESLHDAASSTSEARESHRISEGDGSISMRRSETTEGNESLVKVLTHACQVLGVDVEAIRSASNTDGGGDKDLSLKRTGTTELEALGISGSPDPFGWPELQVGIVREAIAVAESLPGF
jgi:trafficking protein particle complex subunit 9